MYAGALPKNFYLGWMIYNLLITPPLLFMNFRDYKKLKSKVRQVSHLNALSIVSDTLLYIGIYSENGMWVVSSIFFGLMICLVNLLVFFLVSLFLQPVDLDLETIKFIRLRVWRINQITTICLGFTAIVFTVLIGLRLERIFNIVVASFYFEICIFGMSKFFISF